MLHIAALPALVLFRRTSQYDSVRASLAPYAARHFVALSQTRQV